MTLAVACLAVAFATAIAIAYISPSRLEIRSSAFPGFAGAHTVTIVATNSKQWAEHFHESAADERAEEAENAAHGFDEGIVEKFTSRAGEAEYEVQVFSSARSAVREVSQWTREEKARDTHGSDLEISAAPGVADSVLFSELIPRDKESSSNVVFPLGRCWFHLSDGLIRISSRGRGNQATIALAKALDRGMSRVCAEGADRSSRAIVRQDRR
jgi:hypothetical protein